LDKRVWNQRASRTAPARLVKIPYLRGGELSIPHRAYPEIRIFVTEKHRQGDMPMKNPNNPEQKTDQMGLCHFAEGYASAPFWVPEIRSYEAKPRF
jgi:hypothetical protein